MAMTKKAEILEHRLRSAYAESRALLESFQMASKTGDQWNSAEAPPAEVSDLMCVGWVAVAAVLQLSHQIAQLRIDLLEKYQ